jgi:glucose-6-phosphate 1-dehydrogenase
MPVLEAWKATSSGGVPSYPTGSRGPREADALLDQEWQAWAAL